MSAHHRLIALIVACALFMQNLDSTVLGTALPTIARDFGLSPVRLHLAMTAYLLSLAVFMPLRGYPRAITYKNKMLNKFSNGRRLTLIANFRSIE